ncbi:MAG: hypothetical protein KC486_30250 [Myxococcales bacterium]|nr:hypothetical protein [Myxococcales bacterium]
MADSPAIDPALLDRLRRGFPLRLDRMGEFWIADDRVTHPRVQDVLHAGLDVSEGGEPTMHLGDQWCYLTVDDCYLRVIRVRSAADGGALLLQLDDGRSVTLDPTTLWEEPDQGLRCAVPARRSGRPLSARFTNLAQIELAERIDLEAEPRPELVVGDARWPIPESAP